MKVGFTGTRHRPTPDALGALVELLERLRPTEARHGDCLGADAAFHSLVLEKTLAHVFVHPPTNRAMRAYSRPGTRVTMLLPRPYLYRNRDIVDAVDVLIAMPQTAEETIRSGTWSTVRYARKLGRKVYLVLPNGTVKED